jgi:hypothetical protein
MDHPPVVKERARPSANTQDTVVKDDRLDAVDEGYGHWLSFLYQNGTMTLANALADAVVA